MTGDPAYSFGYQSACRDCRHHLPDGVEAGRPNPCRLVRWENERHYTPQWTAGDCQNREAGEPVEQTAGATP